MFSRPVRLKIPGFLRTQIITGSVVDLKVSPRFTSKFVRSLRQEDLISVIQIESCVPYVRTHANLRDFKTRVGKLARDIFFKQRCSECEGALTVEKLTGRMPDHYHAIPFRYFVHILIHLALKRIMWTRREMKTFEEPIEERIGWHTEQGERILLIVFNTAIDQAKFGPRLEEAFGIIQSFIKDTAG